MDDVQFRAIRNGVIAAVVTAVVGFALSSVITSLGSPAAETSPTPTGPACQPSATPLGHGSARGLAGRFLDVWLHAPHEGWAVGYSGDEGSSAQPVLARWDGSSWTASPPAAGLTSTTVDVLEAVDGSADDDVWAVGWSSDGFGRDTLAAHFDGEKWRMSTSPTDASLSDVLSIAPDDSWAVGWGGDQSVGTEHALALHWDGSTWQESSVPAGGGRSGLLAVDGTKNDVWAVGYLHHGPLVLHYNGSSWRRAKASGARGPLTGVSVFHHDIWLASTAVLRGDGTTFAKVATPPKHGSFSGVVATGTDTGWAAGSISSGGSSESLAVQIDADTTRLAKVQASGNDGLEAIALSAGKPVVVGWHKGSKGIVPFAASIEPCASG